MDRRKLVILFSVLIILGLLVLFKERNYFYIAQVNRNLNAGEIKLLAKEQDIKDMLKKQFTLNPGFGGMGYTNEHDGMEIGFSGFPDVRDKIVLTHIETTNQGYSIFNICVGESLENAVQVLKKKGYKKQKDTDRYTYKKGAVDITLYSNAEAKVEKISIGLSSTNKHNVVF